MPTAVLDTDRLGELWRRRSVAAAVAALPDDQRRAARQHHLDADDVGAVARSLRVDRDRAEQLLTAGHRRIVGGLPWLAGDPTCVDARAALLAGTDRSSDLDHIRVCVACRGADLAGTQAILGDPDAWSGVWNEPVMIASSRSSWRRGVVAAAIAVGAVLAIVTLAVVAFGGSSMTDQSLVAAATLDGDGGATATVEVFDDPAGARIVLDASSLPEPPTGSFYQAWLKRGDRLVTIGTFSRGGVVVLWSGLPVQLGDLITVTLEPDDGDASSSGVRVLAGPLEMSTAP